MFTELIKFSSVFGSKYKQKINAHLHSNQQTYTSCANVQIKTSSNHRLESAGLNALVKILGVEKIESVTENWRYFRFPPSQVS